MGMRGGRDVSKVRFGGTLLATVIVALLSLSSSEAETFIGGTTPSQRPEGAPSIEAFQKSPEWYATATAGISQPVPSSVKFLDDQGAWYTPFTHPGMLAPYDIRGLHAPRGSSDRAKSDH